MGMRMATWLPYGPSEVSSVGGAGPETGQA